MALNKTVANAIKDNAITSAKIEDGAITAAKIDPTANITQTKSSFSATAPSYSSLTPSIADPGSATAITITGANFISMPTVEFVSSAGPIVKASIVTFTSSTQIVATIPSGQTPGTYKVRVENPKGLACLSTDTIMYSIAPLWSTNAGSILSILEGESISVSVLALDDDSTAITSYAITSGALPSGVTLNTSTGLISGTAPLVNANTTFNFGIQATDNESQQTTREFSITVEDFAITNSCRFNDADTATLEKALGTPTSQKKFTYSCWFKRGVLSGDQSLFSCGSSGDDEWNDFRLGSGGEIQWYIDRDESYYLTTDRLFRDVSAWYHFVIAVDTTQATDTNRVKIYVNGTQIPTADLNVTGYPAQNYDLTAMASGENVSIGKRAKGGALNLDGYLAETCYIDGLALTPTSFGEYDSVSPTMWKPKDVSGLTFGNNGFYLDFKDSANLGNDKNGGTDLTEANLVAADQASDNPTNNFATWNPLYKDTGGPIVYSEGNTTATETANSWTSAHSTIGMFGGKFYWECKLASFSGGSASYMGAATVDYATSKTNSGSFIGQDNSSIGYYASDGKVEKGGVASAFGASWGAGDIIGMALDLDNNFAYWSKNGTWQNSGDPTSGASGTGGVALPSDMDGGELITFSISPNESVMQANFGGSSGFAIASGNADANGYGSFEYAVPTGYLALNTTNLGNSGG